MVKEHMTVPVFGNGNCFTLADAKEWQSRTGVDGSFAFGFNMGRAVFVERFYWPQLIPSCM
jgi:tRNA-dihydrouridine synthase